MKKVVLLLIFTTILCLPTWYLIFFYPHLDKMNEISNRGVNTSGEKSDLLYRYAIAAETKHRFHRYALDQVYQNVTGNKGSTVWNALNNSLWNFMGNVQFDEKYILGLWVDCALYECGFGLNKASNIFYEKNLVQLNNKELASIVVMVRSPSKFKIGSDESEKRINTIMSQ